MTFTYSMAVFVGALRDVVEEFTSNLMTRVGTNDGQSASAKQSMQMLAGRGEALTQTVGILMADMAASVMAADASTRFDVPARHALKARCAMLGCAATQSASWCWAPAPMPSAGRASCR